MTIEDKIRDDKLHYDVNRESAKISALSSGKIEYPTGEDIGHPDQSRILGQDKLTYSRILV